MGELLQYAQCTNRTTTWRQQRATLTVIRRTAQCIPSRPSRERFAWLRCKHPPPACGQHIRSLKCRHPAATHLPAQVTRQVHGTLSRAHAPAADRRLHIARQRQRLCVRPCALRRRPAQRWAPPGRPPTRRARPQLGHPGLAHAPASMHGSPQRCCHAPASHRCHAGCLRRVGHARVSPICCGGLRRGCRIRWCRQGGAAAPGTCCLMRQPCLTGLSSPRRDGSSRRCVSCRSSSSGARCSSRCCGRCRRAAPTPARWWPR